MFKSPFAYPGGKTFCRKTLLQHIATHSRSITTYIEPFVGGGSVALAVASHFPDIRNIVINDADKGVSSLWQCIFNPSIRKKLCQRIADTKLCMGLLKSCEKCLESDDLLNAAIRS